MESKAAQLRRRYPTMELLEKAAASSGSKANLAAALGVRKQHINEHIKFLENGPRKRSKGPRVNNCDLTDKELDARIKEMFGCKYGEVTVYKLTEGYVSGQNGLEGLEFVGTETGRGGMSLWGRGRGWADEQGD